MTTFVDLRDPAAVRAAAAGLRRAGDALVEDERPMPEPDWGDDRFGEALRASYSLDVVAEVRAAKPKLALGFGNLADSAATAADQHEQQDITDAAGFSKV